MTGAAKNNTTWDRIMMAITFAEADDEKSTRELLDPRKTEPRPDAARLMRLKAGMTA